MGRGGEYVGWWIIGGIYTILDSNVKKRADSF